MSKKSPEEILDAIEADLEAVMKKHGVKPADTSKGSRRWWVDREDDGDDNIISLCVAVKKE